MISAYALDPSHISSSNPKTSSTHASHKKPAKIAPATPRPNPICATFGAIAAFVAFAVPLELVPVWKLPPLVEATVVLADVEAAVDD